MDEAKRELCKALAAVITDEMYFQSQVDRALLDMPDFIADRILDHFDVRVRDAG